ncbi:hypothetical protein LEMLEM_LOCUS20128 [Lemmus lemmus]
MGRMNLCILCRNSQQCQILESPLLDSDESQPCLEDVRHRGDEAECHRGQDTV